MNKHDPKDPQQMAAMARDTRVRALAKELFELTCEYRYSYNFSWLGRPIIQYPEDLMALQELIFRTKPELVIETGIAHGGSLIFFASMLELLGGEGRVVGIDVEIRPHNRVEIEAHPLFRRIDMIEGSSIDAAVVEEAAKAAAGRAAVLVILDSNHTHAHVLEELRAYAPLVTPGSYVVVMDTVVDDLPDDFFPDRPWGVGDNPKTAVHAFLREHSDFQIDRSIQDKLLCTVAPDGYLRREG